MSTQMNISKGRANELVNRIKNNDPANSGLIIVLLRTSEADSALQDYTNLSALLAASGNVEANFTNYSRKTLTDTDLAFPVVNNSTNTQSIAVPAVQWVSAGGGANNTLVKGIVAFCPDITSINLANCVPFTAHDVSETTTGTNLNLNAGIILTSS